MLAPLIMASLGYSRLVVVVRLTRDQQLVIRVNLNLDRVSFALLACPTGDRRMSAIERHVIDVPHHVSALSPSTLWVQPDA